VDDIPCIEIWGNKGIIFNSHLNDIDNSNNNDMNSNSISSTCTWSSEFGDGFFRVAKNISGDFMILCRFGGQHIHRKDKSTIIFKYQNSTG
jgi:hypothetical protein